SLHDALPILFALPLRITSVCVSNMLSSLPSAWVLPRGTRSRVWRSTCWTRGIISSSGFVQYRRIALLDASGDRARKLLGLPNNAAGYIHQFDVGVLHLL